MEYRNASTINFAKGTPQSNGSMYSMVGITTAIALLLGMGLMVASKMGELDAKEPPLLKPRVPFIGHLLGMLRWQVSYMSMLR